MLEQFHLQGWIQERNQALLSALFMPVSCLAYASILKMEAICFSETSVDFQQTTRRCIPKDITLHNDRCENLSSYRLHACYLLNHCLLIETSKFNTFDNSAWFWTLPCFTSLQFTFMLLLSCRCILILSISATFSEEVPLHEMPTVC
jgi:hypothetical protein